MKQLKKFLIHQIWYQGEENIPQKYFKNRDSIREHHEKESEIILWDERKIEKLLFDEFSWFYATWLSMPLMIQKIDAAKMMILWKYGGIYYDMDMEFIKSPLSTYQTLKNNNIQIAMSKFDSPIVKVAAKILRMDLFVNNAFFYVSVLQHDFCIDVLKAIENVIQTNTIHLTQLTKVSKTTGPALVSSIALKYKNNSHFHFFDRQVFEARSLNDSDREKTIAIHHSEGNWLPKIVSKAVIKANQMTVTNRRIVLFGSLIGAFLLLILVIVLIIVFTKKKSVLKKG